MRARDVTVRGGVGRARRCAALNLGNPGAVASGCARSRPPRRCARGRRRVPSAWRSLRRTALCGSAAAAFGGAAASDGGSDARGGAADAVAAGAGRSLPWHQWRWHGGRASLRPPGPQRRAVRLAEAPPARAVAIVLGAAGRRAALLVANGALGGEGGGGEGGRALKSWAWWLPMGSNRGGLGHHCRMDIGWRTSFGAPPSFSLLRRVAHGWLAATVSTGTRHREVHSAEGGELLRVYRIFWLVWSSDGVRNAVLEPLGHSRIQLQL